MKNDLTINRPDFSAVKPAEIEARLDELIADCQRVIDQVSTLESPTWETLVRPQEESHNKLNLFWSPVSHLNSVMNSDELRDAYHACMPKLSAFYTAIGTNTALYNTTLRLRDSAEFETLSEQQQKSLNNEIRDFELGGVSLSDEHKTRYAEIAQSMSKLKTEFSDNVLDATNKWENSSTM